MEKILSEKESLDLINVMINSARNNLQKGTGKIFLLWGYVIAVLALANLALFIALPPQIDYYSFYVWFATPLGLIVYFNQLRKIKEMQMVRTYVDKIVTYVWMAFSMAVFTLVISMLLASIQGFGRPEDHFGPLDWIHWSFMIPFMLILYGFALLVSGLAYRFKPLIIGAVICWFCTLVNFSFSHLDRTMEIQLISLILSIIAGYIIPGHLLNSKEKEHVQGS
jgi:hypothetical protein